MLSGIWRRIRSLGGHTAAPGGKAPAPHPYVPDLPHAAKPSAPSTPPAQVEREDQPVMEGPHNIESPRVADLQAAPIPSGEAPSPSIQNRAESLSTRLLEDETLHRSLSDDEFRPMLDWAIGRIAELADSCSKLPGAQAEARFERASQQLIELLRVVDLAVGQRAAASQATVASRLQMLDTFFGPPLVDEEAADRARSRLEALVAQPPQRLQAVKGSELTERLAEALR